MTTPTFTGKNTGELIRQRYAHVKVEEITIDNDAFLTDQAAAEVIMIDNRNNAELLIHLFNNAGINSFDYEISGHAEEVDTPPALTVAPTEWHVLPGGTGTVANNASDAKTVTDDWAWIAVRLKRTTAGQNSVADVFMREAKN